MSLREEAQRLGVAFDESTSDVELEAMIELRRPGGEYTDEVDRRIKSRIECYGADPDPGDSTCEMCPADARCMRYLALHSLPQVEREIGMPNASAEELSQYIFVSPEVLREAKRVLQKARTGKLEPIEDAPELLELIGMQPTTSPESSVQVEAIVEDPLEDSLEDPPEEPVPIAEAPAAEPEELASIAEGLAFVASAEAQAAEREESAKPVRVVDIDEVWSTTRFHKEQERMGVAGILYSGMVLRRSFRGAVHEVRVHKDHYSYKGRSYPTLYAVTQLITERGGKRTPWSAGRFWKIAKLKENAARAES